MSKETSTSRLVARNVSKSTQSEANENGFETSPNPIHFPPHRTPLNAIQDPSQYQTDLQDPDFDSHHKLEAGRPGRPGNAGLSYGTPRVSGRAGAKAQSEPNSAQSTPAKRASIGGATGPCAVSRAPPLYTGGRGSSSRVFRGVSVENSEFPVDVPHFELVDDPSFWTDHNVQVLIRIRPLSTMERVSQGYGQCLRQESAQTLVWLGHPETRFTFDHIAWETISQENLFRVAGLPMVENCMSGYNSCMFAYGQTGSGKTYTMMGEIYEMEGRLNEDCGITPRIFEYLFTRIRAEEESRRDEKLRYSCKCSFLEIYNEQITDLLETSSTNLQLREDLKKGVYVENLTEYNVRTVNDVVKLLLQGAANRKMAATHMNSESSRSHSVFTCIIESRWEKDSMSLFRFARLNLVDLAGSERQKSSGAEGDRLKEAANINKSLSTLGLVIMSLVDLAHGKHRHVPYRDSRLTFLLQDSLGGNSKTTIIANVSPAICSANETLSTLKFAQRAKLIQNNAKVNEDASGDVTALQRQIQQLKGQLSILMKHNNLTRSISNYIPPFEESGLNDLSEECDSLGERKPTGNHNIHSPQSRKMKCMEATLVGALRREKMAETAVRKLEAEIGHVNRLACQREEEAQHTKMMLRFCEEKIKQLELVVHGSLSSENYLMEENKALLAEIQLLRARIDRNPELTRFALENIRLHEQLQLFQNFYEQGEREKLLAEVSELRKQLLETLEGNILFSTRNDNQDSDTIKELEDCRNMNFKLIREVDELQTELSKYLNCSQASDSVTSSFSKDSGEFRQTDNCSLVENIYIQSDLGEEITSRTQADDEALQNIIDKNVGDDSVSQPIDTQKELIDARLLIEAMESEQVHLITELQHTQEENQRLVGMLSNKEKIDRQSVLEVQSHLLKLGDLETQNMGLLMEGREDIERKVLQAKLDKMSKDLEEVRSLNNQYREDQAFHSSQQHQIELVCEQVEMETSKTILHLQEDVAALQLELHERFCYMTQENSSLRNTIAAKEEEIKALRMEWERATLELTSFLVDGSKSLKDASGQIDGIARSFPQASSCISEHVERAARVCMEKEESILLLEKSLEDAQMMVMEMELKLRSLKDATMALNEFQQLDTDESTEAIHLSKLLYENTNMANMEDSECKIKKDQVNEAGQCANAAFLAGEWLSDCHKVAQRNDVEKDIPILKLAKPTDVGNHKISETKADTNVLALEYVEAQVKLARSGVLESENAINEFYTDIEMHISSLQIDVCKISSAYRELVQDLVKEIHETRKTYMEFRENHKNSLFYTVESLSMEPQKFLNLGNQNHTLTQIRDRLAETNDILESIKDCINTKVNMCECFSDSEDSVEADTWNLDSSISGSDVSTESVASGIKLDGISCTSCSRFPPGINMMALKVEGLVVQSDDQESEKSKKLLEGSEAESEATRFCLRKELEMVFDAFSQLYVHLTTLLSGSDVRDCSYPEELKQVIPSIELGMEKAEVGCYNTREVVADAKVNQPFSFLTKFEETRATMREADLMLNALLKANENAKQLTDMWKQTGENLMVERASLVEEVEQLKSLLRSKEGENELLQDQIHYGLEEIVNSFSLLEGCFQQMQKVVDERFNMIYSDALSIGQEMLYIVSNSRSSLEDICTETMEKRFALFVLYQCHVEELTSKLPCFNAQPGLYHSRHQECSPVINLKSISSGKDDIMGADEKVIGEGGECEIVRKLEEGEVGLSSDNLIYENLALKKELERKEVLLEGLLFDFRLLQESTSNTKDIKDETEKLIFSLSQVRHELEMKTSQLDDMLVQYRKLEGHLAHTEKALLISNSDLEQANNTIDCYSNQNAELKVLLKDLYLKKSETEVLLDEQKEMVKGLEKEILHLTSSVEKQSLSLVKGIEDELRRVTSERDELCEQVQSLNATLEMAYALADEKEAIAVEARQESEASKIYAEQKEEEVKILEHSVEELERTINVLEKKVYEMDEEVERHRLIRDSLELELQALRLTFSSVENFTGNVDSGNSNAEQLEEHISRQLHSTLVELHEAQNQIKLLEEEKSDRDKQIKQYKEYISELVLHAEAQASQYQQKYKTLEAMVHEVKTDLSYSTSNTPSLDKTERSSMRTRGSSSPFRCITNLVQQMNLENDQELSVARHRIEELEALVASQQKEVCMLNTRLAAAESMTHDVIRDLLGVKLDMTNYANLIEQYQVQRLVEEAHQQTGEFLAKEQEILNLRKRIKDLLEERESCISEINKKEADIIAVEITVEQLRERDQLLSAQNEMLKMDKTNLKRKVAELDEMVKALLGPPPSMQQQTQLTLKNKDNSSLKLGVGDADFAKRLAHSEKLLSHVNDEIAQYRRSSGSHLNDRTYGHGLETKYRKHKA